jgi:hypothetical protein
MWPDAQTIKHILTVLLDRQAKSTENLEDEKGTNNDVDINIIGRDTNIADLPFRS